jgi:NAD(P)-dependent dehydrogenase (short-subunit alcohol dehydrogenase family)
MTHIIFSSDLKRAAMKIEGSVALVTGANRGIGKAIAQELLARGASRVYAGVRHLDSVTDDRLVPVELDVTDPAQVAGAAERLTDLQIVVNNAGIGRGSTPLTANLGHRGPVQRRRGALTPRTVGWRGCPALNLFGP